MESGISEGKKKRKEQNETMSEFTKVMGADAVKKSPGGKKKKAEKIAPEEIAEKLHILFAGLAKVFKYDYPYSSADFEQESRALVRLNEKFPFIASLITVFDPVLMILGLYFKWVAMAKRREEKKSEVKDNAYPKVA